MDGQSEYQPPEIKYQAITADAIQTARKIYTHLGIRNPSLLEASLYTYLPYLEYVTKYPNKLDAQGLHVSYEDGSQEIVLCTTDKDGHEIADNVLQEATLHETIEHQVASLSQSFFYRTRTQGEADSFGFERRGYRLRVAGVSFFNGIQEAAIQLATRTGLHPEAPIGITTDETIAYENYMFLVQDLSRAAAAKSTFSTFGRVREFFEKFEGAFTSSLYTHDKKVQTRLARFLRQGLGNKQSNLLKYVFNTYGSEGIQMIGLLGVRFHGENDSQIHARDIHILRYFDNNRMVPVDRHDVHKQVMQQVPERHRKYVDILPELARDVFYPDPLHQLTVRKNKISPATAIETNIQE